MLPPARSISAVHRVAPDSVWLPVSFWPFPSTQETGSSWRITILPAGILFLGTDPHLEELGFDKGKMIAAINGKKAQDIFLQKWEKNAGGFEQDHYTDLISYLFVEHNSDEIVLTVYLDVPRSYDEIPGYKPRIEHWLIKIG